MKISIVVAAAIIACASGAAAQTPAASPPVAPRPSVGAPLKLSQAQVVAAAALAEAQRQGFTMAVAVVEPDGSLVAFNRLDGTQYASIAVAQDKARSAALYRQTTLSFSEAVAGGRVQVLSLRDAVAIEGGVPLVLNGKLIGAVGVSGGSSKEDGVVAAAGAAALR